jgi:hypothetical protein
MATEEQIASRADELALSFQVIGAEPAVCVSLRSEERMQRAFVLLYQSLVFLLAVATVLLLISFIYRISKQADVTAGLQALGALVTGIAAGWLEKQRRDARLQLRATQRLLTKNNCQSG